MNSEYSNNPLTEVALALSMAFFSIMVLSIFALSQKQNKSLINETLTIKSNFPVKKEVLKKRKIIFYFNNNFFTKDFKIWIPKNDTKYLNGYTLAVPPQISVKKLFDLKNTFKNLDVKFTQQNKEWNDAFKNKLIKKDIK
jgi:hypothetical protein